MTTNNFITFINSLNAMKWTIQKHSGVRCRSHFHLLPLASLYFVIRPELLTFRQSNSRIYSHDRSHDLLNQWQISGTRNCVVPNKRENAALCSTARQTRQLLQNCGARDTTNAAKTAETTCAAKAAEVNMRNKSGWNYVTVNDIH